LTERSPEAVADVTRPVAARSESLREPGTKIGRYVILERVGVGGMGVVFAAYDPELDRRVAIKLLASDLITRESRLRLLREAQAMARLSHPNVVPVYDAGTVDGQVFVAMEFVQGVTLREWLDAQARPWTDVLEAMRRAALGLQAAHDAGLVHRDFKPDNVMVGDDGRVRVLDFGLARSATLRSDPEDVQATADDGEPKSTALSALLTHEGVVLGTPAYMAPEQREGGDVDARTDQWSFCATLYEALYGTRPFEGTAVHAGGVRPPPNSSPVPSSIFAAVARGLELDPDARHPSMGALLDALELPLAPRRRVLPAAVVALGAALAVPLWWSAHDDDEACESRALAAAAVWSAEAQQAGADAFGRSSLGNRAEAWSRASARLGDYVTAWEHEAGRVCRGAQSETAEVDALRNRCLDTRLRRLTTVVDAFASADDHVVREAVATVYELPPLEACADVAGLFATASLPDDPTTRAELARLEGELETVASHSISGDYVAGRTLAEAVVDDARGVDYAPFTAKTLTTLASFDERLDDPDAARDRCIEAFELSVAVHDNAGAAKAATRLASVLALDLRSPDEAEVWMTVAASMVARAGGEERSLEAELRNVVGAAARTRGDYERALSELSAARETWQALPGEHPLELAAVSDSIAGVLHDLGRLDESRDEHLRALEIHEETLGPNHLRTATSLDKLGNIALSRGDLAEARAYKERALAIWRATLPPGHTNIATGEMHLGMTLSWSGEFDEAIELLEHALELDIAARGPEHPEVARTMHNLAAAYVLEGNHDEEAEAVYRRELAIRRKVLRPDHPVLASALRDLGELLLVRDKAEEGLRLIEEALEIRTKALPDHPETVIFWFSLSRAHEANGHGAESVDAAEEAVAVAERSGSGDFDLARARAQLGKIRWSVGEDRAEARRLVERAAAAMAETPDLSVGEQSELQAWLKAHPLPE